MEKGTSHPTCSPHPLTPYILISSPTHYHLPFLILKSITVSPSTHFQPHSVNPTSLLLYSYPPPNVSTFVSNTTVAKNSSCSTLSNGTTKRPYKTFKITRFAQSINGVLWHRFWFVDTRTGRYRRVNKLCLFQMWFTNVSSIWEMVSNSEVKGYCLIIICILNFLHQQRILICVMFYARLFPHILIEYTTPKVLNVTIYHTDANLDKLQDCLSRTTRVW